MSVAKELCDSHYQQMRRGQELKPIRDRSPRGSQVGLCRFDDCNRKAKRKFLCAAHYRQQLRGDELTSLRVPTPPPSDGLCTFEGCMNPHEAKGLCRSHNSQQRRGNELTPLGSTNSESRKAYWAALTENEKAQRVAAMHSGGSYERDDTWRRQRSEQMRANWAEKQGDFSWQQEPRICRCGNEFLPNSARQIWCERECRLWFDRCRKHGPIDDEQIIDLKARKELGCEICHDTTMPMHLDHDHGTSRVRGLLCITCNTGLGKFGDDPAQLRRAADYLERAAL